MCPVCSGTAAWQRLSALGSFKTRAVVMYSTVSIVAAVPMAPRLACPGALPLCVRLTGEHRPGEGQSSTGLFFSAGLFCSVLPTPALGSGSGLEGTRFAGNRGCAGSELPELRCGTQGQGLAVGLAVLC